MEAIRAINQAVQMAEDVLKPFGYMPFLGAATGGLRATMGVGEILTGACAAPIGMVTWCATRIVDAPSKVVMQCDMVARFGIDHLVNGFLNVGRGGIECVPFLGNACCLIYDMAMGGAPLVPRLLPV